MTSIDHKDAPAVARLGNCPPTEPGAEPPTLARTSTIVFVFTLLASVLNYLSNLVFGRLLTPAEYGDLTALLALVVVVAIPSGAAQTIVAERLARDRATSDERDVAWLIRYSTGHIGVVAGAVGLTYALCIPLVTSTLNLQAPGPAFALLPLVVLTFFLALASGFLQGLDRFVSLGIVMLAVAVGRLAFGVPWAANGGGSGGAIGGQAIGTLLAVLGVGWMLRRQFRAAPTGSATAGMRRQPDVRALVASAAVAAFALLSNLDVLLAKLLLSPDQSGHYAALATVGKLIFFLPSAVAIAMVPNAARARREGDQSSVLRVAALLTGGVALLVATPAILVPEFTLRLMFGENYVDAANGVLPIAIAGVGLAVLNLLVVYTVAMQDRRWPLLLLGGIAAQLGAILLFGHSPESIATAQAVVIVGLLIVNELLFHPLLRAERMIIGRSS